MGLPEDELEVAAVAAPAELFERTLSPVNSLDGSSEAPTFGFI